MVSSARLFRLEDFAELTTITASRYRARASRPSAPRCARRSLPLLCEEGNVTINIRPPGSFLLDGGIHATSHIHRHLYHLSVAEHNHPSSARNERRSVAEPQWRQRKHKKCSARSDQQEQRPKTARCMPPSCGGGRTTRPTSRTEVI